LEEWGVEDILFEWFLADNGERGISGRGDGSVVQLWEQRPWVETRWRGPVRRAAFHAHTVDAVLDDILGGRYWSVLVSGELLMC